MTPCIQVLGSLTAIINSALEYCLRVSAVLKVSFGVAAYLAVASRIRFGELGAPPHDGFLWGTEKPRTGIGRGDGEIANRGDDDSCNAFDDVKPARGE